MQDAARGSAAAGERASVEGPNVSGKNRSRRRWSDEEKARVVRESLRPGKRVGEVARRYGISRWQLSTWRSAARRGELAVAPAAVVDSESQPAFVALEVDRATGPGPTGSVVIEAREATRNRASTSCCPGTSTRHHAEVKVGSSHCLPSIAA